MIYDDNQYEHDPLNLEAFVGEEQEEIAVPGLTEDILNRLDKLFPEQSAFLSWHDREVWWRGGQRAVVRFLREQFELEQNTSKGTSIDVQ